MFRFTTKAIHAGDAKTAGLSSASRKGFAVSSPENNPHKNRRNPRNHHQGTIPDLSIFRGGLIFPCNKVFGAPNRKLLSQGGGGPVIGTWRRYDMRRSNNVTIVTKLCSRLLDLFWECFRKKRAMLEYTTLHSPNIPVQIYIYLPTTFGLN